MWQGLRMTILPCLTSLRARQVRIIVTPHASTLFESRAILSGVQSRFGAISTFINERYDLGLSYILRSGPKPSAFASDPPSQSILAVFDSPRSKSSALNSAPFVVSCGGDLLPSSKDLDPYNARGLQGRHHPPKKTFTCHIVQEEDSTIHQRLTEKHPYSDPFRIDTLQMSYRDLIKSGASKEVADVMQIEKVPFVPKQKQRNRKQPIGHTILPPSTGPFSQQNGSDDPHHEAGLMAAWRRGLKQKSASGGGG